MKWLEREQSLLHREKQTKTNQSIIKAWNNEGSKLFILQKKCKYVTIATMEREKYENEYFIKTIYTLLFKI